MEEYFMRISYITTDPNIKHNEGVFNLSSSVPKVPLYNKDTINLNFCGIIDKPEYKVDVNNIKRHVNEISAIVPRAKNDIEGLNKAADYVKGEWEKLGLEVHEQRYKCTLNGPEYRNLYVNLGPKDAERLIIGAHYDAVHSDVPGADDNASAVAGLLESTRLLKEAQDRGELNIGVNLVAFTLEEGAPTKKLKDIGSARYAKMIEEEIAGGAKKPLGMISLEMIGYFKDKPGSQKFPTNIIWGDKGDFIAVVGLHRDKKFINKIRNLMSKNNPQMHVEKFAALQIFPMDLHALRSDHLFFALNRICPAIMITDTINFRNPYYHTSKDKPNTLDPWKLSEVVKSVTGAVIDFSR